MLPTKCPCTKTILMKSLLENPIGINLFAVDKNFRYLIFSKTHQETMKNIWGIDIYEGACILDFINDLSDKQKAKKNFTRAFFGEYFSHKEEYGDNNLKRTIWKNDYSPLYDENDEIIGVSVFVSDLTDAIKYEKILKISQIQQKIDKQIQLLLNSIGDGIYGVDLEGKCFFINPTALNILGFCENEIIGKDTHTLMHHHKKDGEIFTKEECIIHHAVINNEQIAQRDWLFKKNGEIFPVEIIATPISQDGIVYGTVISFRDITQQYEMEEKLKKINEELHLQSITDPLTKLFNRRYFMDIGLKQFEISLNNQKPFSLLSFDIDYFKKFNDTYGHDFGDKVLVNVSKIAKESLRLDDILARVGGEEFTAILINTDYQKAIEIAERLRTSVKNSFLELDKEKISCTISIGVATANDESDFSKLLKDADIKLYKAKNNGRNRVE